MPSCSNCGEKIEAGLDYCPNCGARVDRKPMSAPAEVPEPLPARPRGVTIVAILEWVSGPLTLRFSLRSLPTVKHILKYPRFYSGMTGGLAIPFACIVILDVFLGIATMVVGWELLKLRKWACKAAIILAVISVATSPIKSVGAVHFVLGADSNILIPIIAGVVIWYLTRPNIKAWFR